MKKTPTAPRSEYATKDVTDLMNGYAEWLTSQTGYAVDARSVFLSSALRTAFQAERRAEKQALLDSITVPKKPRTRKRGSTIATADGVVIAEQQHIDAVSA